MPSWNVLIGESFLDVPAGAHSYAVFHWNASPVYTHGIYLVVDQADRIDESNDANNMAYKNIYVQSLPDLSVLAGDVSTVPSVVYKGFSVLIKAVIRNLGEAPVSSFIVRFLAEGVQLADRIVSLGGEDYLSLDASWTPTANGTRNVSVLVDPLNWVAEPLKMNNRADKAVIVLSLPANATTTTTTGANSSTTSGFPPGPTDLTTTSFLDSCVLPGNGLPCNEVTLEEVVSGITAWVDGNIALNDVIALINSWADQAGYPPV